VNLNQHIESSTTPPHKGKISTDDVSYRGRKIRTLAIYHEGERKWEGWSGISFTGADHFIGRYTGLLDLSDTREDALATALYVAMAWLDALELGVEATRGENSLAQQAE
jgi:hypothetical protein